jgi:hypothetical protein
MHAPTDGGINGWLGGALFKITFNHLSKDFRSSEKLKGQIWQRHYTNILPQPT